MKIQQQLVSNSSARQSPRKNNLTIFSLISLIIIFFGIIFYFSFQYFQFEKNKSTNSLLPKPTPVISKISPTISKQNETNNLSDWKTYINNDYNFTFKYPNSVEVTTDPQNMFSKQKITLSVQAIPVNKIGEAPLGYNQENSLQDQESLKNKQYGHNIDFSHKQSEQVINLDGVNAKSFMVFSRFEVCDVTFERKIIIYKNNNRVILDFSFPYNLLIEDSPQYFTKDKANCGDYQTWDRSSSLNFYEDLINQKTGPLSIQNYQLFDQILSTFKFTD